MPSRPVALDRPSRLISSLAMVACGKPTSLRAEVVLLGKYGSSHA